MSRKANTTAIGAFVLGAIVLAVASLVILGSGKFLKTTRKYVMFFEGSVKGLQVGAPVVIRGVKVGQVSDIVLEFDTSRMAMSIPVYADIDPSKVTVVGKAGGPRTSSGDIDQALVDLGLRAQLQTQSYVTGLLMIDLDFRPNTPVRLVGSDRRHFEIPTVPSDLQQLSKKLDELPLQAIAQKLDATLEGVQRLINSPHVEQTLARLDRLVADLDTLAQTANVEVKAFGTRTDKLMGNTDSPLQLLAASVRQTSEAARETLGHASRAIEEAHGAVGDVRQIAAQNANLGYELTLSMDQMTALARSLRSLSDYLERHPEALVRGKGGP